MTIKIVLVDEQEIVRAGLRLLLEAQPDLQVVGEAGNTANALTLCSQSVPDAIIMGLETGALEATRALKRRQPRAIIVALATREDKQHFIEIAQAGASVYLPKRAALTDLVNAIRAACMGQVILHPSIATQLVGSYRPRIQSAANELTAQEERFLALLSKGAQNKTIASTLNVSLRTIARYQASLLRKFNLNSRADLVRYVVEHAAPSPTPE